MGGGRSGHVNTHRISARKHNNQVSPATPNGTPPDDGWRGVVGRGSSGYAGDDVLGGSGHPRTGASRQRSVGWTVGLVVTLVGIVGVTRALSAPDEALYQARTFITHDSQVFPQRAIGNGPLLAIYFKRLSPSMQLEVSR
jgi:hypothetical protein